MDTDTYDQIHVPAATVGDGAGLPAARTRASSWPCTRASRSTSSCRPASSWSITYTEPGLQGDRSTGGTKPATLETGAEIQVPLFITTGEKIKVDTRDGRYLGRVDGLRPAAMAARSKARKRALDVLFEADLRGADRGWSTLRRAAGRRPTRRSPEYAVELVEGVAAHRDRIDELIDDVRRGLDAGPDARRRPRHPAAGASTSCSGATTSPDAVAIDEAVELAKALSTDDSPRFVNGVLGRDLLELARLRRVEPPPADASPRLTGRTPSTAGVAVARQRGPHPAGQ